MKKYKYQKAPNAIDGAPDLLVVDAWNDGEDKRKMLHLATPTQGHAPHLAMDPHTCLLGWYKHASPVEVWEPEEGEVVAAWDHIQQGGDSVMIAPYTHQRSVRLYRGDEVPYTYIARIPEDFKLTAETLMVAWWEANGEKHEATT
jgi:hypothetical protein